MPDYERAVAIGKELGCTSRIIGGEPASRGGTSWEIKVTHPVSGKSATLKTLTRKGQPQPDPSTALADMAGIARMCDKSDIHRTSEQADNIRALMGSDYKAVVRGTL